MSTGTSNIMNHLINTTGNIRDCDLQMIGDAVILASIQFSIGSVEMSSKFSVRNFAKDQETLDSAVAALSEYIKIAIYWTVGIALLLYLNFGLKGAIYGIVANVAVVYWIYHSYVKSFKYAAETHKLVVPPLNLFG